ncbi:MAG: putative selenate reductase subunit YgfK [Gemmatimonadales bacterium]|nr:putative selenate reductase subunit YgfK [Gemmatimonadales bacterium]
MSSDLFTCTSLDTLFKWVFEYDKNDQILGISKDLFYLPNSDDSFTMQRYGQTLETPIGLAAGPHTQLSQNIICAWLTGARYTELKTVQVLDELEVTKPCIDMSDEGYNCEWSQELKLDQSFDEYLNAWIMLHVLRDKFNLDAGESGFIFNMSVGYNLEGIMSPAVQRFLDKMTDCSELRDKKIEEIAAFFPRIKELKIPAEITRNITISTMHGCPPSETEKIGRYFIEDRKLDTTIKLNPTLLGADKLREILNEKLGFDTVVPDLAFEHDLEYGAGVALIRSLSESAKKAGVAFNLKLTNTLETTNVRQNLPKNEEMVYMSGRALHPISINLAAKLQKEFKGKLDISFSGGADCFNISDVLKCGLMPVTICTDVLKPGGYGRISQYLENIEADFAEAGASTITEYILKTSGKNSLEEAIVANLADYAEEVTKKIYYNKTEYPYESVKTARSLEFFDCAQAPCMSQCPAGQEIPRYLNYVANGDLEKAHQTVLATNPFPNVQGMVCDHMCQSKCTRINYEKPVLIREVKRYIADKFKGDPPRPAETNGVKVAVIGAGPSGLSCAHFLALSGYEIDLYEAKDFMGGMAADGIPVFRLDDERLKKDIDGIISLGVNVHLNTRVTGDKFNQIKSNSDYVYIAVGAQESMPLNIPRIESDGVFDQLSFLSKVRKNEPLPSADKIIVLGAGNSAMDAARTAKRLVGTQGEVAIVYRRTRREMPCDPEEVRGALEEGIQLIELAAPESIVTKDGKVTGLQVSRMKLGEPDESGRARPIKIEGSEFVIDAGIVIPAIGQMVVLDFLPRNSMTVNEKTHETEIENVFAGGDAFRGASSLINAIGDGQKVAAEIVKRAGRDPLQFNSPDDNRNLDLGTLQILQARRDFGPGLPEVAPGERINFDLFMGTLSDEDAAKEAARCLQCDLVCNVCTTVCPNRSNMYYQMESVVMPVERAERAGGKVEIIREKNIEIRQNYQIINIGDYCNECGNCTTFCPTAGKPYRDKPKFHLTEDSFNNADFGFYFSAESAMKIKTDSGISVLTVVGDKFHYEDNNLLAILDSDHLTTENVTFKNDGCNAMDLCFIAQYVVLYKNVRPTAPFVSLAHVE